MGARGAARRQFWVEEPVKFEAQLDGAVIPVEVTGSGGRYHLVLGSEELDVDARPTGGGGGSLLIGHASSVAEVAGGSGRCRRAPRGAAGGRSSAATPPRSPMWRKRTAATSSMWKARPTRSGSRR